VLRRAEALRARAAAQARTQARPRAA
jgi:hypothetical protein